MSQDSSLFLSLAKINALPDSMKRVFVSRAAAQLTQKGETLAGMFEEDAVAIVKAVVDGNGDSLIEKRPALDALHGEGSLNSSNNGAKLSGEDVQPVVETEEKDKTQVNSIPFEGIGINRSSEMILQEHIGESHHHRHRSTDRASDVALPGEESRQLTNGYTNRDAFNQVHSRCLEDIRIDFPVEYLQSLVAKPGAFSLAIFGAQGGHCQQYHLIHESNWTWKHYGFIKLSENIREITIVVHSEYLGDLTFFHLSEHQLPQGSHTSVIPPPLRKEQQAVDDNQCILGYSLVFSKGEYLNRLQTHQQEISDAEACKHFFERCVVISKDDCEAANEIVTTGMGLLSSIPSEHLLRRPTILAIAYAALKLVVSTEHSHPNRLLDHVTSLLNEASSFQLDDSLELISKLRTVVNNSRDDEMFPDLDGVFPQNLAPEHFFNVDWESALIRCNQAIKQTPKGDPLHRRLSIQLALATVAVASKEQRSSSSGSLEDLDERIAIVKEALDNERWIQDELSLSLSHLRQFLAEALAQRSTASKDLVDINDALWNYQKLVATITDPSEKFTLQIRLVKILCQYGSRCSDKEFLKEAQSILTACVAERLPEDHSRDDTIFGCWLCLVQASKEISQIDESLLDLPSHLNPQGELLEVYNNLCQGLRGYPSNPNGWLNGLLRHLEDNYRRSIQKDMDGQGVERVNHALMLGSMLVHQDNPDSIKEGILLLQKSSLSVEDDDPVAHYHLGSSYRQLYRIYQDPHYIEKAVYHHSREAVHSTTLQGRLTAAQNWWDAAGTAATQTHSAQMTWVPDIINASETIIRLATQLAGLELTVDRRHQHLKGVSKYVQLLSTVVTMSGDSTRVLRWLEEGRGLVWSQINSLRSPLNELHIHHPALASRLATLSRELEVAGARVRYSAEELLSATAEERISFQEVEMIHVKLAKEREELIKTIRTTVPGFEDFLQPPSCSVRWTDLPASGPVVVLSAGGVIMLIPGLEEPVHLPLDFSFQRAERLRDRWRLSLSENQLRQREEMGRAIRPAGRKSLSEVIKGILRELWTEIVKPILDALAFSRSGSETPSTRIWWCPTGPFTSLPIHAAGIYGGKTSESVTVLDYAVSSYIPTVSLLADRVRNTRPMPEDKAGICLLSQANAPDCTPISGTKKEINKIADVIGSSSTRSLRLEDSAATKANLLTAMENHSWIHLACHGTQNAERPLASSFALADGRLELLTIIKSDLKHAEFAFLSACQTSTGDIELSDESVHLAAGMLAAGYRGVVGTMWSISDSHAPQFAEDFYQYLLARSGEPGGRDMLDGEQAAYALHHAIQQLRKREGSDLYIWAPYVHWGL